MKSPPARRTRRLSVAAGILSKAETTELREALDAIAAEFASNAGKVEMRNHATAEDIHHFVELKLVERVGDLALKLHTGRSRNEQIATDLRLYVRAQIELVVGGLAAWAGALVEQGRDAGDSVMPSYTHLQRAEPVLVAHWLLAYVEMALRDADRLLDCAARLNFCPLGSGAVAGATLPLDRTIAARELGFTSANRQFDRRDERSRLYSRVPATRSHSLACTSAALPRRSLCLPLRNSALSLCPRHFPRDRAPCRRRRIPI